MLLTKYRKDVCFNNILLPKLPWSPRVGNTFSLKVLLEKYIVQIMCTAIKQAILLYLRTLITYLRQSEIRWLNVLGIDIYEGCSKRIAYLYLEKYSFHALEVLPVARNAKFQPMYPLLEGVTVRWFGHSNKVLMNGRSKCLSGLVFPPSKECFQFRKQKEITWGKVWGIRGVRQNSYFFFLQKRRNYCGGMSWGIVM